MRAGVLGLCEGQELTSLSLGTRACAHTALSGGPHSLIREAQLKLRHWPRLTWAVNSGAGSHLGLLHSRKPFPSSVPLPSPLPPTSLPQASGSVPAAVGRQFANPDHPVISSHPQRQSSSHQLVTGVLAVVATLPGTNPSLSLFSACLCKETKADCLGNLGKKAGENISFQKRSPKGSLLYQIPWQLL